MQNLRHLHRIATLFLGIVLLFLSVTGTLIQGIDLRSIYAAVPATDPNVRAMREGFDGPPDFAVRTTNDYLAKPLPKEFAYAPALDRVVSEARVDLGNTQQRYVEFRMAGDMPVAVVGLTRGHARFDARSGNLLERNAADVTEPMSPVSLRNTVKSLHRMTTFGDWALYINLLAVVALGVLIVTGTLIYFKLLRQRRKIKRPALFWSAGGTWRTLHRAVALVCAIFLTVVTLSGAWLAMDGLYRSFDVAAHPNQSAAGEFTPLNDDMLPRMLGVTLESLHQTAPLAIVKVVRLRIYGGYRQGIVVTGGDRSQQLVFNADTGRPMSETEAGYPRVHFPFGWQAHQWAKGIHRGDFIGLPGRWMDLIAGLALLYLSTSGAVMYWQMWQRRRQGGRKQLLWK